MLVLSYSTRMGASGFVIVALTHFKARYIREVEWKMVSLSGYTTWHLYKIKQDETELNDVPAQYTEVADKLSPCNGVGGPITTRCFQNLRLEEVVIPCH